MVNTGDMLSFTLRNRKDLYWHLPDQENMG